MLMVIVIIVTMTVMRIIGGKSFTYSYYGVLPMRDTRDTRSLSPKGNILCKVQQDKLHIFIEPCIILPTSLLYRHKENTDTLILLK